jgi:hypothetical protein
MQIFSSKPAIPNYDPKGMGQAFPNGPWQDGRSDNCSGSAKLRVPFGFDRSLVTFASAVGSPSGYTTLDAAISAAKQITQDGSKSLFVYKWDNTPYHLHPAEILPGGLTDATQTDYRVGSARENAIAFASPHELALVNGDHVVLSKNDGSWQKF